MNKRIEMTGIEYRHGLIEAQIEIDLPLQIRALRKNRQWTQPELAAATGMKQPRISAMEKPGGANFTLETLKRLAKAFDVALVVHFGPFSELVDWSERFDPQGFSALSYCEEFEANGVIRQPNSRQDLNRGISADTAQWSGPPQAPESAIAAARTGLTLIDSAKQFGANEKERNKIEIDIQQADQWRRPPVSSAAQACWSAIR